MRTVFLDGRQYSSGGDVHLALKRMLHLPDHYGCNADALYDCLSEERQCPSLVVMAMGEGEAADTMEKIIRVFQSLGGNVKRIS